MINLKKFSFYFPFVEYIIDMENKNSNKYTRITSMDILYCIFLLVFKKSFAPWNFYYSTYFIVSLDTKIKHFFSPLRCIKRLFIPNGLLSPTPSFRKCFNENPLKMIKNTFCFILKTPFVLKMLNFWSWLFWSCRKTDYKANVCFKIYDVINWERNNCNTHNAQYLKK